MFSACNMAGRFWGSLSDRLGSGTAGRSSCCASSHAALAVTGKGGWMLLFWGYGLASCYGGWPPPPPPHRPHVRPPYITENYGVMYVVFGLASLIGPSLATTFKTAEAAELHRRLFDRRGAGRHRPGALPLPESPASQRRMIWN